jgi:hypothetical protein
MQKLELVEQEINSQGRIGKENQDWLRGLPYEAAKTLLTAINIVEGAEGVEGACASPGSQSPVRLQAGSYIWICALQPDAYGVFRMDCRPSALICPAFWTEMADDIGRLPLRPIAQSL